MLLPNLGDSIISGSISTSLLSSEHQFLQRLLRSRFNVKLPFTMDSDAEESVPAATQAAPAKENYNADNLPAAFW